MYSMLLCQTCEYHLDVLLSLVRTEASFMSVCFALIDGGLWASDGF